MRILTLWQPWATLRALDEKRNETRSFGTSYRGPIAIHAAQRFPDEAKAVCRLEPFRSVLREHGILEPEMLPLGVILCVTRLRDVVPTDGLEALEAILAGGRFEKNFGNYSAGRRIWIMDRKCVRLEPPIPYKGSQGLRAMPGAIAGELAHRLMTGAPTQ